MLLVNAGSVMAAMLRNSVADVAAVRMRPRAVPLAMKKSTYGLPFLSYTSMGLRLMTLRAAGAPLKSHEKYIHIYLFI